MEECGALDLGRWGDVYNGDESALFVACFVSVDAGVECVDLRVVGTKEGLAVRGVEDCNERCSDGEGLWAGAGSSAGRCANASPTTTSTVAAAVAIAVLSHRRP